MIRILAAAAMVSAFAVPSFAAPFNDGPWQATPKTPTAKTAFIAEQVSWSCDSTGCKSLNDTTLASAMIACKAAAKQLGPLSQFVGDRGPLTEAKLAQCNQAAAPQTMLTKQ